MNGHIITQPNQYLYWPLLTPSGTWKSSWLDKSTDPLFIITHIPTGIGERKTPRWAMTAILFLSRSRAQQQVSYWDKI